MHCFFIFTYILLYFLLFIFYLLFILAPFNASRAMDLVSASADALSFVNTFPQPKGTHRSYDAHRYGWWHSFAIDGISDEERLFLDTDHVMTLEEICKITGDVYSSVHDKVLGEYDTVGCKISSDKNRCGFDLCFTHNL